MKKYLILIAVVVSVGGCVNFEAIQRAMDRVDTAWQVDNRKLLKLAGVRTYEMSKKRAFQAWVISLSDLGFIIKNQDFTTGFILASAQIPTPLTKNEWAQVKKVEEPRMQKIAAGETDAFTASLFVLSDSNFDVLVNILMIERANDLQMTLNFQMVYTGPKTPVGYGQQPPPEAVKFALQKTWDQFERVALIQSKTLQ